MTKTFPEIVHKWYLDKGVSYVNLSESFQLDEGELDYTVIYEANFHSERMDFLTFSVYLTDTDMVGISIEPYSRIAARLGVGTFYKERIAGGWEPGLFFADLQGKYDEVFEVMELASSGKLLVYAKTNYFSGLSGAYIVEHGDASPHLKKVKNVGKGINIFYTAHLLRYIPWE
jgi:hypothetical protein